MSKPFVAILMDSDSDFPVMQSTLDVLNSFGIAYEVKVTSAHRTPAATHAYVSDAEKRGCKVFICAAGLAAHLAGAVAGNPGCAAAPTGLVVLAGSRAVVKERAAPAGERMAAVAAPGGYRARPSAWEP